MSERPRSPAKSEPGRTGPVPSRPPSYGTPSRSCATPGHRDEPGAPPRRRRGRGAMICSRRRRRRPVLRNLRNLRINNSCLRPSRRTITRPPASPVHQMSRDVSPRSVFSVSSCSSALLGVPAGRSETSPAIHCWAPRPPRLQRPVRDARTHDAWPDGLAVPLATCMPPAPFVTISVLRPSGSTSCGRRAAGLRWLPRPALQRTRYPRRTQMLFRRPSAWSRRDWRQ